MTMEDFLKFVGERKAELLRELQELEAAERLYRESRKAQRATESAKEQDQGVEIELKRPSIKEAVMIIIQENPRGLTAREIMLRIRERWDWDIARTSLSPQLSRLGYEQKLINQNSVWKPFIQGTIRGLSF